jgi:hypothetical protein
MDRVHSLLVCGGIEVKGERVIWLNAWGGSCVFERINIAFALVVFLLVFATHLLPGDSIALACCSIEHILCKLLILFISLRLHTKPQTLLSAIELLFSD